MTLSLTSLHWEEYETIMEIAMSAPIEIKLPNGLIIAMLPNVQPGSLMKLKEPKVLENDAELWARFVHALSTTDWKALASVYSTAMPAPVVPRPAPGASKPVAVPTTPKEAPAK